MRIDIPPTPILSLHLTPKRRIISLKTPIISHEFEVLLKSKKMLIFFERSNKSCSSARVVVVNCNK